jgi:uncharacterized protein (TIGR02677 family)
VSRRSELLALAGALERSRSDDDAWTLWTTATGLFSARHLALPSPQPGGPPGAVSFWDAEPCTIEQRLRRQGTRSLTGRPSRMADRSKGREAARAHAAAVRAATATTRAAVLARSGQRLSAWADVDAPQLDILMTMLAAVAAAGDCETQVRSTRTGDQIWQLTSEPPLPGAPSAVVHTPHGRLVHPDVRLTFSVIADAVTQAALRAAEADFSSGTSAGGDSGSTDGSDADRAAS